MNQPLRRQHAAATLGLLGGSLGVIAGLVQATAGTQIPGWTGNKASPVALGVLTILLSGVALLCAVQLRSKTPLSPGRWVATAIGLLLPGALCFSTVGALWWLPGALLLLATVAAATAADARETRGVIAAHWLQALVCVLGTFELLMAVSAGPAATIAVGVLGGLALIAAPWTAAARPRVLLLLLGTIPFAALTWWSLASPLLALLALAIGLTTLRQLARTNPVNEPTPRRRGAVTGEQARLRLGR